MQTSARRPSRIPLRARRRPEEPPLEGACGYGCRQPAGGRGRDTWPRFVARNAGPRRSMPSGVLLQPLGSPECRSGPGLVTHPPVPFPSARSSPPAALFTSATGGRHCRAGHNRSSASAACFCAYFHGDMVLSPLAEIGGFVNLRALGPPFHSFQVPATSPPGNVFHL